ncbi:hypothetical protein FRC11_012838 [Ceratobasidium sp. 423]|nr:hypothetical protein FRC11_012838 [Ceratobasidium sp. 423]
MSEPAASGAHPMETVSESKPTGGKQDRPLVPSSNRQQNAVAVQQIISLNSRLQLATQQINSQQLLIEELQLRDEESKQAINELTLCIDSCEKNNQVLQKTLEMDTKSLGIDLSQTSRTSDSPAGTSARSQTDNSTKEENEQVSKIIKAAFLILYGITKFNPRDHGPYPTVSKEHVAWPYKYDGNRRVAFQRFNFSKNFSYASPCNNDLFQARVELSTKQVAAFAGHTELLRHALNGNTVTNHVLPTSGISSGAFGTASRMIKLWLLVLNVVGNAQTNLWLA